MILKKPYGLLIKHFKLIHFILTALSVYLAIQTKIIVDFFRDYVINNYSVTITDNLVSTNIHFIVYILLFLIILMLVAMYVLLKYKKKPNKFYFIAIVYYTVLFLMILIAVYLIGSLSEGFWETASARQYRDFSQLVYWPQYIFIIFLSIRALGFDIKKFDFKSDLKELELTEQDSELIEINLGFDTTKVQRTLRRLVREFTYYFKENKFIFVCAVVVGFLFLGYLVYSNYEKIQYTYKQGAAFTYDNFNIKIEDSIITNVSYDGRLIDPDKYYLLIKLNATNNDKKEKAIAYDNFKIYIQKNVITPTLDIGNHFIDYAKPYFGEKLRPDESKTYLLTYVIDSSMINKDFEITLYNGAAKKKENFTAKTIVAKLNPVVLDKVTVVGETALNSPITFGGSYLNNTSLAITDYKIGNKYDYKYKTCYYDTCKEYDDYISLDYSSKQAKTLLVVGYDFALDNTSLYSDSFKNISSFATHFMKVRYTIKGSELMADVENITPINLTDKLVLKTTKSIETADKVHLFITIRNKSYAINLFNNIK